MITFVARSYLAAAVAIVVFTVFLFVAFFVAELRSVDNPQDRADAAKVNAQLQAIVERERAKQH
ncbi:MAG: hypothetical protein WAN59_09605 [Candidatus Baltobacteraceae bacterium]|jgi:hypothetical protein